VSTIAPAASVLLARGMQSQETFIIKRSRQLRFFGGFYAFPGGKVTEEDERFSLPPPVIAAARELFEETGILIARRGDGTFAPSGDVLDEYRQQLLNEELEFADLLERLQLIVTPSDFQFIGTATTPAFSPLRFRTEFYVACLPENLEATVWPG
jgi:8-oxo-dGTP pyrophosphatase MutT (NUDIX family)